MFYASEWLENHVFDRTLTEDEQAGVRVIVEACRQPLRVIVENTGKSPDVVMHALRAHGGKTLTSFLRDLSGFSQKPDEAIYQNSKKLLETRLRQGYDANTHEYVNLIDKGIIDPLKVERSSLEHASSVVGLLLTTNAIVVSE